MYDIGLSSDRGLDPASKPLEVVCSQVAMNSATKSVAKTKPNPPVSRSWIGKGSAAAGVVAAAALTYQFAFASTGSIHFADSLQFDRELRPLERVDNASSNEEFLVSIKRDFVTAPQLDPTVTASINNEINKNRTVSQTPIVEPAAKGTENAAPDIKHYVVQPGDTLSGIAKRLNTELNDLIAENKIKDPGKITPGMKLLVPDAG